MPSASKLAVVAVLIVAAAGVFAEDYNCDNEGRVCLNGGVCHERPLVQPSGGANGWTTPFCMCQAPYGGTDCSSTIRECKDSPCQNGGTCSPASCTQSGGFNIYDCFTCECPRGWGGAPPYTNNGVCDWKLPINDCSVNSCQNGGTCSSSSLDSYSCACSPNYFGANSIPTAMVSAYNCTVPTCALEGVNTGCHHGGTCQLSNGVYTCFCSSGWAGLYCDIPTFCSSGTACPAGSTCHDNTAANDGTGYCAFPPNNCIYNGGCLNGGTCIGGSCSCPSPYDGTHSCNSTLFCQSNPCQHSGTCRDTVPTEQGGAGFCICPDGWVGQFCDLQTTGCGYMNGENQIGCNAHSNGCSLPQHNSPFSAAVNIPFGVCECPAGGVGAVSYYDCRCNSTFVSACPGAVGGNVLDGQNSDMVCQNGGTCTELADFVGCSCRRGFWGDKCQNYDNPCLNNPCENGGQCTWDLETVSNNFPLQLDDRWWAWRCNCKWPYYGKNCEKTAPFPTSDGADPVVCGLNNSPCQNGGTCRANEYQTAVGGFFYNDPHTREDVEAEPWFCDCPTGYYGQMCENVADQCTPTYCGVGYCNPTVPGATAPVCQCPCGYAGDRCEVKASNADATQVQQMQGAGGGVGYRLEFCSQVTCQNGGTCYHNINGQGFTCACKSGWAGTYCGYSVRSAASGVLPSLMAVAAAVAVAFALKH